MKAVFNKYFTTIFFFSKRKFFLTRLGEVMTNDQIIHYIKPVHSLVGHYRVSEVILKCSAVLAVVFTALFCPLVFLTRNLLHVQFEEASLTYRCLPSYMPVHGAVCADRCVSKRRSKTGNHLYRLHCAARSAHVASVSRSEREMTAEGWKRKRKRNKEKRKLKRKAIAAVKADPSSTGMFTQASYLDGH